MLGGRRMKRNEKEEDNWRIIALYSGSFIFILCI